MTDLLHRLVLAVEDARPAVEAQLVDAGDLHDAAVRRQRAAEDGEPALGVDGVAQRVDDLAIGGGRVEGVDVLRERPPGDGEAVAVQEPGVEQLLHDNLHTADAVEVRHVEAAVGLHVGDVGHALADAVEVLELQFDAGLVGDGEEVEHCVGGAAEGVGDGDGVLERLLGHDLAGPDALLEQADHGLAAGEGEVVAAAVDSGGGRATGQAHAQRLGHRRHGVGSEHPGAGADRRAGVALDERELFVAEAARGVGADSLEDADDVEGLVPEAPGQDGAAVEEDAGQVETGGGHQHAGQRLVAAGEGHHAVKALGVHHHLDGVGDDLPAHE